MSTSSRFGDLGRRRFLQTTAALAVGGAALGAARPAAAQADPDLGEWFADVSNYDGVVDARGESRVAVAVGAEGNGGGFAFEPAAVRVDPGTTVVWEWTGAGGSHNVVAEDGAYESALTGTAGDTFEYAFAAEGVSTYACTPHRAMGMKGAVIVGDRAVTAPTPDYAYVDREPDYDGWFDDVDGFQGTVDMRGRSEVRVQVGAAGSGGGLAFAPAAVHVDPGTNVIWEWVGDDGPHRLAAMDGEFESPAKSRGTWGLRFDGVGVSKYQCVTHGDADMKGAVVVGDVYAGVHDLTANSLSVIGSVGAALLSPVAFGAFLWFRDRRGPRSP